MKELAPIEVPSALILGVIFVVFFIVMVGLAAMADEENKEQKLKKKEKQLKEKEVELKKIERELRRFT